MQVDHMQRKYLNIAERTRVRILSEYSIKQLLFNETFYVLSTTKKSCLKCLARAIFTDGQEYRVNIQHRSLMFLSTLYCRREYDKYWKKTKKLFSEYDEICISDTCSTRNKLSTIKWEQLFISAYWFVSIWRDLKLYKNVWHRMYFSAKLLGQYKACVLFEKLELSPKVIICFFDSGYIENVAMQYFKNKGAITVTNQHGQPTFRSWNHDRMNQSQILNFKCDYFISRGKYVKNQFIKAGIAPEKIICLGSLNKNTRKYTSNKKGCFAIFLDFPYLPFSNRSNSLLINYARKIADKLNYNYLIKIHPADLIEKYINLVDKKCVGIYGKNTSLNNILKKIDFGIIHASSTYSDILNYGLKAYRLITDIEFPLVNSDEDLFDSVNSFIEKYEIWNSRSEIEKKEYLSKVATYYEESDNSEEKILNFVNYLLQL